MERGASNRALFLYEQGLASKLTLRSLASLRMTELASEVEGAGVGDAGFGGVAAFDAADVEELFAAAL